MKLSDIASIKSGLVLSRKAADSYDSVIYKYNQLNLKCINENGTIDLDQLDYYESKEELNANYLSQVGDIIVRLTVPNTAALITDETKNIVVSSHFCMIRVNKKEILPEYLQWYLNSEIVKKQIAGSIMGSAFAAVKPGFYNELKLKLPSIKEQKIIAEFYKLAMKEIRLLEDLKQEKEMLYNYVLANYYKKLK
jgi:restriction endonuclease S subunit